MPERDSNSREHLSAGIYASLVAVLFLLCLAGAFVLPPSFSMGKWLGLPALLGFFIGTPFLERIAHRSRIDHAVYQRGGRLVSVKRLPFLQQPRAFTAYSGFLPLRFEVIYTDLFGARRRALCDSGFFQGVKWLADEPLT